MDQQQFPMFDSNVPSDRFYDDFGLRFRFIERDSTRHDLFYYWLSGDSEQRIRCDIYTGRIRATRPGEEGFAQIRAYLQKAVAAHREHNPLDRIVSYTGEGSFSNSLSAWKDESITLREQFPAAFRDADGAKFYMFYMYPDIKEVLAREMARTDVDLMLFHEHGTPDRQWLTHRTPGRTNEQIYTNGRLAARQLLRRNVRYKADPMKTRDRYIKEYGIDSTWFDGWDDPAVIDRDSLDDLATGIVLEDVRRYNPNPRFVIFDACYNGDFREQEFIAAEYILGSGRNIVCLGNSVNVLQDKSSSDLLGLLDSGTRVGQWAQQVHILESHVIGDPTFRFSPSATAKPLDTDSRDTDYWLSVLNDKTRPADEQSLALYRLFELEYDGLSELLRDTYFSSPYYTQRLQCLHLLPFYDDGNYATVLKAAMEDPYEFIRRSTVNWMGDVGRDDYLPLLVKEYAENYFSERERFDIGMVMRVFNNKALKKAIDEVLSASYVDDKDDIADNLLRENDMMSDINERILNTSAKPGGRKSMINSLKNSNMHMYVPQYVKLLLNPDESDEVKVAMLQALAWFTHSVNRQPIIDVCRQLMNDDQVSALVRTNALRTYNRLK